MQNIDKPKYLTFGCKLSFLLYACIILNYQLIFYSKFVLPFQTDLNDNQVGGEIMSFFFAVIASLYNPLFRFDVILIFINLAIIFFFVPLLETKYSSSFVIKEIILHNICFQVAFTFLSFFQFQNSFYYPVILLGYFWLPITIYKADQNVIDNKIKTIGSPLFLQKNYVPSIILIILCSRLWSYFLYGLIIYYVLTWLDIIRIQTKFIEINKHKYQQIQDKLPVFITKKKDFFKVQKQVQDKKSSQQPLIINNQNKEEIIIVQKKNPQSFKQKWQAEQRSQDLEMPQTKSKDELKKQRVQYFKQEHMNMQKIKKQFQSSSDEYKKVWKDK